MAGHTGDRATVSAGLRSPDPRARSVAIGAAARLGMLDPEIVIPFLTDDDPAVRRRAIEEAGRLPHSGPTGSLLVHGLVAALDDPATAEIAAFGLGELLGEAEVPASARDLAVDRLGCQATGHDDPLCRESAVAALGAIGAGLSHILAATDDVATVRRRAVLALAPFDGQAVDRALRRALDDRDWQVRQAAEDLLAPDDDA